jgi:hypothetical protein
MNPLQPSSAMPSNETGEGREMRAKRDRQASTPIAFGPFALMMLVVLPAVAYGLNTGGLGPWFVAAAGTALAFTKAKGSR